MWNRFIFSFFGLSLVKCVSSAQNLTSPLQTNWGEWGQFERCPHGTKVISVEVKTEAWNSWGSATDDTCLNAVRFNCGDPTTFKVIRSITSTEGDWGKWGKVFNCNGKGYVIGFMTRSEEAGHAILDETAMNNLRILCDGSEDGFIELDGESWGEWTNPRICDAHEYVCGLKTQIQSYQGFFSDDTSLNNIMVECCDLEEK